MASANRIDAGDLRLRRHRRYQAVRRFVLSISVASVCIAPLLFIQQLQNQSSGISGDGRWAAIASHLPSATSPTLGAPWTIRLFRLEFLDPLAAAGLIAARSFVLGAAIGLLPTFVLVAILGPAGHATPNRQFPLLLVTGPRTRAYVNSQFRRIPSIAMKMPEPMVELHPRAALDSGVNEGSRVAVVFPRGRIELRLQISDRIHPAIAVVSAGWAITNANLLTDDTALDPVSGFPAFRGGVCRIEKA